MKKIKLFVMDVDGTLTDGKINMAASGELFKAFDIKDGYGVNEVLPEHGILTAIITGRESKIVQNRAKELNVDFVLQGIKKKKEKLDEIISDLGITYNEVAYIGDDIIDLECMELCGIAGCPSDAVKKVMQASDFISRYKGGEGAVRDFIEWIVER